MIDKAGSKLTWQIPHHLSWWGSGCFAAELAGTGRRVGVVLSSTPLVAMYLSACHFSFPKHISHLPTATTRWKSSKRALEILLGATGRKGLWGLRDSTQALNSILRVGRHPNWPTQVGRNKGEHCGSDREEAVCSRRVGRESDNEHRVSGTAWQPGPCQTFCGPQCHRQFQTCVCKHPETLASPRCVYGEREKKKRKRTHSFIVVSVHSCPSERMLA